MLKKISYSVAAWTIQAMMFVADMFSKILHLCASCTYDFHDINGSAGADGAQTIAFLRFFALLLRFLRVSEVIIYAMRLK